MNELALFAGAGGGILAGKELGWRTVCGVERNGYAAQVLAQRQNDGILEPFPIWSDVETFDGRSWRGIVDVVSGGFPCQDISAAGSGEGITGKRSGLWKEMARIICEVRPRYAFIENSPMLIVRGLDTVLCDLAAMGYHAKWGVVSASYVGAKHKRERTWIVAHASSKRQPRQGRAKNALHKKQDKIRKANLLVTKIGWPAEPELGRVADGVAHRMDRLTAIGNGQVPQCAAEAWRILSGYYD